MGKDFPATEITEFSYRTNVVARALARSNLLFYGTFWSKGGCRAAKKQEQRLAMT